MGSRVLGSGLGRLVTLKTSPQNVSRSHRMEITSENKTVIALRSSILSGDRQTAKKEVRWEESFFKSMV